MYNGHHRDLATGVEWQQHPALHVEALIAPDETARLERSGHAGVHMGEIAPFTRAADAYLRWLGIGFIRGRQRLGRTGPGRTGVLAVQSFRTAPQNVGCCRRTPGTQIDYLLLVAREQRGAQLSLTAPCQGHA